MRQPLYFDKEIIRVESMNNSTIAAISTAQGAGGIGVIRISGADAIAVADRVFKPAGGRKLEDYLGYTAGFGHIYDDGQKIDEAVALVLRRLIHTLVKML